MINNIVYYNYEKNLSMGEGCLFNFSKHRQVNSLITKCFFFKCSKSKIITREENNWAELVRRVSAATSFPERGVEGI